MGDDVGFIIYSDADRIADVTEQQRRLIATAKRCTYAYNVDDLSCLSENKTKTVCFSPVLILMKVMT